MLMKTTVQSWLAALSTTLALSTAMPTAAQETNLVVETNLSAATNLLVESTVADSNAPAAVQENRQKSKHKGNAQPIVMFGQDVEVKPWESAEVVVVIGGSAKVHGKVKEAVVTIGGSSEVDGEVGEAVVAVMGNVHLKPGARVHEDAVAVMGTLTADSGAEVSGDAVSVGGKFNIADGAEIHGEKANVGLPVPFVNMDWLGKWMQHCLFKLRPLAPQVGFVWIIAGIYFLLYLFIAAVFPRPVQACLDNLTQRPATTFLMGLLTKMLVPLVVLILVATGLGLIVVPFLWVALFVAAVFGKVAVLEWIGLKLGRNFGAGFQKPLVGFLIGTVLLTVLYIVPVLGLISYTLFGIWGLGCAITATFSRTRREIPEKPAAPPPPGESLPVMAVAAPLSPADSPGAASGGTSTSPVAAAPAPRVTSATQPVAGVPAAVPAAVPPVLSFPRAGFWERMGAAFLDLMAVALMAGIAQGPLGWFMAYLSGPPVFFIIALAYFAGLWTWKGTTIGGVVLKLQVVRQDGGPLTFLVAFVRGLAAAFSGVVLFLGFFWIGWDREKQGWHDKIAGTVVVRLPRSMPLVCL